MVDVNQATDEHTQAVHHSTHHHANGEEKTAPVEQVEQAKLTAPLYKEVEAKFSFKKQTVPDELGNIVKRPPVTVTFPVPTFDGVVRMMEMPKVTNFILDLVEDAIRDQVRAQLNESENPAMRQEDLDMSKLTLDYIANMSRAERTGSGISTEAWGEWEKDYVSTMVPIRAATENNAAERVGKAAKLFTQKFNPCRTDKPVLEFLQKQLAVWATNSPNVEDHSEVFTFLDNRVGTLLNKEQTNTLDAL